MTSIQGLTAQQYLAIRERVATAAVVGAQEQRHRLEISADELIVAEHLMEAGYVDLPRVLEKTRENGELPRVHSVIEVPVPGQEMSDTYFIEDYHAHGNITGLGCRLIKSDYARDEDYGQWLQLSSSQLEGWKYVWPQDARA